MLNCDPITDTDKSFDELIDLKAIDTLLEKAKQVCKSRIHNKVFVGMEKDDVIQEVLIKIYGSVDKYDKNIAKASTYFDHIIMNKIKDCYKKVSAEKNLMVCNAKEYSETPIDIEDNITQAVVVGENDYGYDNVEFMIDVMKYMGLNEREKEIFKLRCAGYEFKEISEIMKVSKPRMSQIWNKIKLKYQAL